MLNPKTNQRELAYITTVTDAKTLDGYERVHYVHVLGWWCVASKNIHVGDRVIYFEVDSVLPESDKRFIFMAPRKYRVKTQKMCKVTSQGLVLPVKDFPEISKCRDGDFVTDKLGVTLFDSDFGKPVTKSKVNAFTKAMDRHKKFFSFPLVKFFMRYQWFRFLMTKVFVKKKDTYIWPAWLTKTNQERVQNVPMLFEDKKSKWILTEKCVAGNTLVRTSDGMIPISKIVNQRLPVQVVSLNEENGCLEYRSVTDYHRVPQTSKFHYRIGVSICGKISRKKFVSCTEDHKFLTSEGWKEAAELKVGDKLMHYAESEYSEILKQMVLGTLLGDASLRRKGSHISVFLCQGIKQKEYLFEKLSLAGSFAGEVGRFVSCYGSETFRADIKTCLWMYVYAKENMLDEHGKVMLTKKWMDDLTPISLAFWYMDDGSLLNSEDDTLQERVVMNTQAYSNEECQMLQRMLERFGISSVLHDKSCYKGNIITIGARSSQRFFTLIAPYVCPCMKYKLPKCFREVPYVLGQYPRSTGNGYCQTEVLSIEKLPPKALGNFMFDITIEGNHNYFANGVLVHNCDGMSTSAWLDEKDVYGVGSHNVVVFHSKNPESKSVGESSAYVQSNVWYEQTEHYNLHDVLKRMKEKYKLKTVAIQGETYGDGIQKRTYGMKCGKHDFAVFHILFDGERVSIPRLVSLCEEFSLPHVHVFDWNYTLPDTVEDLIAVVDSKKSSIDHGMIEGFVLYSQDGQTSYKCVSPSFLLKYH